MKILVICFLLALVCSVSSRRGGRHHGGDSDSGDGDGGGSGGRYGYRGGCNNERSDICSTYTDKTACKEALRTCMGGRRGARPSRSEREAIKTAVEDCLAAYPDIDIPRNFYRSGCYDDLGFLGLTDSADEIVEIRCCIGKATTDYTSTGDLDRNKIKAALTERISDTTILGYLTAAIDDVAVCPKPTDCLTQPFKECYIKACIDEVLP